MTNSEKSQLSGVRETLLYTLYYRVLDQRSNAPIVGLIHPAAMQVCVHGWWT